MADTLEQYQAKLRQVIADLEANKTTILAGYGADIIGLIQERIQTEGKSGEGTKLKEYSDGYLAFKKAPQNTKRGRALGLGSSRYTGVVDYTLTGRMWNNIGLVASSESGESVTVVYGAKEPLNINKLKWLAERDGIDPLEPTEDELARAYENVERELDRIISPIS